MLTPAKLAALGRSLLCATAVVAAAAQAGPAPAPAPQAAAATPSNRPAAPPAVAPNHETWLFEQLPQDTLLYLRVPSTLTPASSGTAMGKAAGDERVRQVYQAIREAAIKKWLPSYDPGTAVALDMLLGAAREQVELIVTPDDGARAGLPVRVLASWLSPWRSKAELEGFLQQLAALPPVRLPRDPATTPDYLLNIAGIPAVIRLDEASGRVVLFVGMQASAETLRGELAALRPLDEKHPIRAMQARMDDAGRGLFAWLSPKETGPFLMRLGMAKQVAPLMALGLNTAKGLALGWGTANGKRRLALLLDMPNTSGPRAMLPVARQALSFSSQGAPSSLWVLHIPEREYLLGLEAMLLSTLDKEKRATYDGVVTEFTKLFAMSPVELLAMYGPEFVGIKDAAGDYYVTRLRDPEHYLAWVEQAGKLGGMITEHKDFGSKRIYHSTIPMPNLLQSAFNPGGWKRLGKQLGNLPSHAYWMIEGDYLLSAVVPQPLIERVRNPSPQPVADWLAKQVRADLSDAFIGVARATKGVPRDMYHLDLQVLLALGDLVGHKVDLLSLPGARELDLPALGHASFKLSAGRFMGLELSFEHNPLEGLISGGGSMETVAVVAVLAAIAIPAYNDYVNKAKRAEEQMRREMLERAEQASLQRQLALLQPKMAELREEIGKHYLDQDRFPDRAWFGQRRKVIPRSVAQLTYLPRAGRLIARVKGAPNGSRGRIELTPTVGPSGISWGCKTDLPAKFQACDLPSAAPGPVR